MDSNGTLCRRSGDPRFGSHLLTDGAFECRYQDLPRLYDGLCDALARAEVAPGSCVGLTCPSTLASAVAVLALLDRRDSFLLLPPSRLRLPELPAFCRYRVSVRSRSAGGGGLGVDAPRSGLELDLAVEANPDWNGRPLAGHGGLIYLSTSGSTGAPRFAAFRPEKLLANAANCVTRFALGEPDRIAIPVPICHMFGLGAAFLPAVLAGASVDLQDGTRVLGFVSREREFDPNIAFMTPDLCRSLLQIRKSDRSYDLTVTAGDRLGPSLAAAYEARHGPVISLYGSTELGAIAASGRGHPVAVRHHTVGPLMPGVTLVDTRPATQGEGAASGGMALRFDHRAAFEGYAGADGAPARVDDSSGLPGVAMQDVGTLTESGCLKVLGRVDHHVNRSGRLVSLPSVEEALSGLEGVARVVVVPSGTTRRGCKLYAFFVADNPAGFTGRNWRRECRAVLPEHAIPDSFEPIGDLPRLPSGKVDRERLRRQCEGESLPAAQETH